MLFSFLTLLFFSSAKAAIYEALVINVQTGEVLYEKNADKLTYPASLTKMMTLYLTFQALERGTIHLTDEIPVSAKASNQAPTKLGLRKGQTITIKNAILGMIVKSANDAAVAVAEYLSGSEEAFAKQMTATARKLGMEHTIFKTASGLPNAAQKTTARDMAIISQALYDDYPKYFPLFKTESFVFQGKSYKNHNGLLGKVEGVDGIKTGFINASGFNLAATAVRDGKRFVAILLGSPNVRWRNAHMTDLINAAFEGDFRHIKAPILAAPPKKKALSKKRPKSVNDLLTQIGEQPAKIKKAKAVVLKKSKAKKTSPKKKSSSKSKKSKTRKTKGS